jgi:hypothetical protein
LAVVLFGSYTLLKDYKPLREGLELLRNDIAGFLGLSTGWEVTVQDLRITEGSGQKEPVGSLQQASDSASGKPSGGLVGMGVVSRYAFLYLLITNVIALLFIGYLAWSVTMANT